MSGIIDVFAQYERALIRARTRAALAAKKARGERVGTVSYGFRLSDDGLALVPDAAEQAVAAAARELHASGLTVRATVAVLAAKGVVSRRGRPLGVSQVHALIASA